MLALCFGLGFLGGLVSGLGLRWGIMTRCTRLEWAVGDLQGRVGTLHGKKASAARWEQKDQLDMELAQLMHRQTPARKKYDNDPQAED